VPRVYISLPIGATGHILPIYYCGDHPVQFMLSGHPSHFGFPVIPVNPVILGLSNTAITAYRYIQWARKVYAAAAEK
jgi:hypothetical protein